MTVRTSNWIISSGIVSAIHADPNARTRTINTTLEELKRLFFFFFAVGYDRNVVHLAYFKASRG